MPQLNPKQQAIHQLEEELKFSPFKRVTIAPEDMAGLLLPAVLLRWLEQKYIDIAKKKSAILAPVDVVDYPAYLAELASMNGASELIMEMVQFHNQNTAALGAIAQGEQSSEQPAAYQRGAALLRKDS